MLVALLLLFVLALRSSVVTFVAGLSITLMIVIGMVFVNNYVIINKAFFMLLFLWDFVTLLVFLVMTVRTIMLLIFNMSVVLTRLGSTVHKCGREKKSNEFHLGL